MVLFNRDLFFYKAILLIILFQLPFQNFFLNQSILGVFGTNFSMPLIYMMSMLIFLQNKKISLTILLLLVFTIAISLVFLLVTGNDGKNINLLLKLFNNLVVYSQPFVVFYFFNSLFGKYSNLLEFSIRLCRWIFFVLFIYLIFHYFNIFSLDDNYIVHGIANENKRPRLFSMESSHAGTVFTVFFFIASLNMQSRIKKYVMILFFAFGIFLLNSKGSILVFFILCYFFLLFNHFIKMIFLNVFLLVVLYIYKENIYYFIEPLLIGFEEYTSLTTRTTMVCAAIVSLLYYPIGTGFASYLVLFDECILVAKEIIKNVFYFFNLSPNFIELDKYFISSSSYSTKSIFFDSLMYFGWIGLFVFAYYHIKLFNLAKYNGILMFLFLYLLCSHIFFVDSTYLYHFWLSYALIYNYWRVNS